MTGDRLARFYREAGHRVIESAGATWFDASPRVFQSLPGSRLVDPPREELGRFVRSERLAGVQFATGAEYGLSSCAYAVREKGYGLESTHRAFRQNVVRGMEECEVRELDFGEVERLGPAVNAEALARRGTRDPRFLDPVRWRRLCAAGRTSPGAGALGSFHAGRLAAYLVYLVDSGTCHGLHMLSSDWGRPHRANHLLYFEFTRRMIARPDVACVSTGLRPIPAAGEIDRFKRQAGYRTEPCRLAAVLHPAVRRVLLSRGTAALLARLADARPGDARIRRLRAVADMARASLPAD
jgi:hypothetical protein